VTKNPRHVLRTRSDFDRLTPRKELLGQGQSMLICEPLDVLPLKGDAQ
jgi:hypothetical protein